MGYQIDIAKFKYHILIAVLCSVFVFSQPVHAQQTAPYLYYYSDKENAFVIERVDSTDRHMFAKDITPRQKDPLRIDGPGWSPNGKWFAWRSVYLAEGRASWEGHLFRTGGEEPETLFRYIKNVYAMYWSPNSQYLLTYLNPVGCSDISGYCNIDTYWLIDVTLSSMRLRSIFDIRQQREPIGVEWETDKGEVNLYIWEDASGQSADIAYLKITMHNDGRVEKQPITQEEWKANIPAGDLSSTGDPKDIPSPSGKFTVTLNQMTGSKIQNLTDNTSIPIPSSKFGSQNTMIPVNASWSADEEWVMAGYADFNGIYGTAIFKRDGTQYREINTCGPSPACVGWLPENVNVSELGSTA